MKQEKEELSVGSQSWPPTTEGGSVEKSMDKVFTKDCHKHREFNINNARGCVNLYFLNYTKEELAQFIMDNHGLINF